MKNLKLEELIRIRQKHKRIKETIKFVRILKRLRVWNFYSKHRKRLYYVLNITCISLFLSSFLSIDKEVKDTFLEIFSKKFVQIGESYGRHKVTPDLLQLIQKKNRSYAYLTALVDEKGSGIYIGKYNNEHIVWTNDHVCDKNRCNGGHVKFTLLNKKYPILKSYDGWKKIDTNFLSIDIPKEDETLLQKFIIKTMKKIPQTNEPLLFFGHGLSRNYKKRLILVTDDDCKLLSREEMFWFDNELNEQQRFNLLHGCDTSKGDSGSVIISKNTNEIVGINWGANQTNIDSPIRIHSKALRQIKNNKYNHSLYLSAAISNIDVTNHLKQNYKNKKMPKTIKAIIEDFFNQ